MASGEINKNLQDFSGELGLGSKNLQIRLLGHCIICLRKVRLKRKRVCQTSGGNSSVVLPPEIAPKSVVSTPGFLTTFNRVWTVLQTKWKERNFAENHGNNLSEEEIQISLENVLEKDSVPTNVSFSRAPTICQFCCDKVLAVENLMKAVRQQVREIIMLLEQGRRIQYGGMSGFERSLRESGLKESEVKATLHFVGIFGSSFCPADKIVHLADSDNHDDSFEVIDTSNITKMEYEEETDLGKSLIGIGAEDDNECRSSSGESGDDNEDPDYIKSEEEPEEDESEEEIEQDDIDDDPNDPDYEMSTDPLEFSPEKRKKITPRSRANQGTSRKQQEAEDSKQYVCSCGGKYRSMKALRDHLRRSKLHPEYTAVRAHSQTCYLCGELVMFTDILEHLTNHFSGQAEWVIRCPNEKCRYMGVHWKELKVHKAHRDQCGKMWKEKCGPVCQTCGFRGTNMLHLRNHVRDKHEENGQEKNLKCPISGCGKIFCVKQSVQFHIDEHRYRPKITEQKCDKCGESLNIEEMEGHLKDKHGIEEVIECKQCEMKFPGRDEMVEHLFEHRSAGIICDICETGKQVKFEKYTDFREHYFGVHKLCPRKYKCGKCDKWFWRTKDRDEHELNKHSEENPSANVKYESQFLKGKVAKNFECDVANCNVTYYKKDDVITHKIRVHGADPFRCDICGVTFDKKVNFNKHKKEHVGIPVQWEWKCEVDECGKVFTEKRNWKYHMEVGHGGERAHVCEICGNGYTTAAGLRKHQDSVHLKLRPWVCDQCGERFSTDSVLKRHKLIHTGERPFGCEICGQRFRQKGVLKRHMEGHENKGTEFKPSGPMKQIRKRKAQ